MKRPNNLEALFLVAAALATVASYASAQQPLRAAMTQPAAIVQAAAAPAMQVVVIKGHRLSAAQKAAL